MWRRHVSLKLAPAPSYVVAGRKTGSGHWVVATCHTIRSAPDDPHRSVPAATGDRFLITLYQFPPGFGLPNASPFCMKLETYLRMVGLPFELNNRGQLLKAPKGKLPFIEDCGQRIGDSNFILVYLKRKYGDPLDAQLSAEQRACATAFLRLMEENLYWAALYTRWFNMDGWPLTRKVFFDSLPWPARQLIPFIARRAMRKELHGHGMGRHSEAEIMDIGRADLDALSAFLADKPYFLGEAATSLDATAYAFLANIIWVPVNSPLKRHAAGLPNLEAYCQRMKGRFYADG